MEDHARGASWEYDLWISALAHRSVGLPRSTLEFTSSFPELAPNVGQYSEIRQSSVANSPMRSWKGFWLV
jgi:hypothetical protein